MRGVLPGARTCLRAALAALVVLGTVLLPAATASAHSALISTEPTSGQQVATAPAAVILHFSEGVGLDATSLEVLTARGVRLASSTPAHPEGDPRAVGVTLPTTLGRGSYTVRWHVVSADSHPVRGTFTFGVGVPAGTAPAIDSGDPVLTTVHTTLRVLDLMGVVALLGSLFFVLALWPAGFTDRRWRTVAVLGWGTALISSLGLLWVQGPYGASRGLEGLGDPSLFAETLAGLYGRLTLLRLVALIVLGGLGWHDRHRLQAPGRFDAAGLAFLVVESFSFSGHAGQGPLVPLAATADALHLSAACIWLGGLVVLARSLLPSAGIVQGGDRASDGEPASRLELSLVLARWSRWAAASVGVLVVTGAFQAWRHTSVLPALTGTTYGRLVLVKVALLAVMLLLAATSRAWVVRARAAAVGAAQQVHGDHDTALAHPPAHPPVRSLRAGVVAELSLGVIVLIVTGLLVDSVPARLAYRAPFTASVEAVGTESDTLTVHLRVDPTTVGRQVVTVQVLTPAGAPQTFVAADGTVQDVFNAYGPIRFTLTATGPGRGQAEVIVPATGLWELTVQIHVNDTTDFAAGAAYSVQAAGGS